MYKDKRVQTVSTEIGNKWTNTGFYNSCKFQKRCREQGNELEKGLELGRNQLMLENGQNTERQTKVVMVEVGGISLSLTNQACSGF